MVSGSIWWPRGWGGGQRSPRGAHGAAQPQSPAGFCPWPCFQCLFSLPSLFSRATVAPGPPPQTVQLGHFHTYSIPPQESLLYIKQTFLLPNANRIHSGILQLVLCFCLCIWGCNYWLPSHLHTQLTWAALGGCHGCFIAPLLLFKQPYERGKSIQSPKQLCISAAVGPFIWPSSCYWPITSFTTQLTCWPLEARPALQLWTVHAYCTAQMRCKSSVAICHPCIPFDSWFKDRGGKLCIIHRDTVQVLA